MANNMNYERRIIILLGPPGSGKGTQSAILARSLSLIPISTGELLRKECDSGSAIGQQVRDLLAAGFLVGNDLMNEIVAKRLDGSDCPNGCILDGYPRTVEQARFLDQLLHDQGIPEPVVFDFVVSAEQAIERLSQRRQCPTCGHIYSAEFDVYGKDLTCDLDGTALVRRSDDNPASIRERLAIYARNTRDLVEFYKGRRYSAIDAMQTPDRIARELLTHMTVESPAPQRIAVSNRLERRPQTEQENSR